MDSIARSVFYLLAIFSAFVHNPLHNPFATVNQYLIPADMPVSHPGTSAGASSTVPASTPTLRTGNKSGPASKPSSSVPEASVVHANTSPVQADAVGYPTFQFHENYGEMDAYDNYGNHTGSTTIQYEGTQVPWIEQRIPGLYADEIGTDIMFSFSERRDVKIVIKGFAEGEEYLFVSADNQDLGKYLVQTKPGSVSTLPVTYEGDHVTIGPLSVDLNGDGTVDQVIHGDSAQVQ